MYGMLTNNFNLNRKEDKRKAFEKPWGECILTDRTATSVKQKARSQVKD